VGIVARVAGAAIGTAAVATVAKLTGEGVAEGVDRFLNDPTYGPGWLTGASSKAAKQQAAAAALVAGSGVKPWVPKP
jgi:hypothetical protein